MQTNQIHSLRQTHQSVSTLMRLVTAGLTISGIVLASMEHNSRQRNAGRNSEPQPDFSGQFPGQYQAQQTNPQQFGYPYAISPRVTRVVPVVTPVAAPQVIYRARRLTFFGFLGALLTRVVMVLFGMVAVAGIVVAYFSADATWRAIELTTLILLILYLTERVARSRRG